MGLDGLGGGRKVAVVVLLPLETHNRQETRGVTTARLERSNKATGIWTQQLISQQSCVGGWLAGM